MARTIMIVEDEKALRDTLEFVLLTEGHTVLTAVHGEDALRMMDYAVPDVIILDLNMPVMDGREFALQYRDRGGLKAPIILCSSGGNEGIAQEIGAVDYLQKPFSVSDLLAALERSGGKRRSPTPSSGSDGSRGRAWSIDSRRDVEPPRQPVEAPPAPRKREEVIRPLAGSTVECRGCRKVIPSHLAYSLRGHSGYRCKACLDLLMEGITTRGRAASAVRERRHHV
jgi:CheY-like chemotaxis protein